MKKLQINDNYSRSVLNEGRNYGMGFSILNKINNFEFDTLLPFSACKAYLNDIVYKTYYDNNMKLLAHGYNATEIKTFKNKKFFYFGLNMLHYKSGKNWNKFDEAKKELFTNYMNMVNVINKFEKLINGSNYKTSFYKKNDDVIILKVPMFWVRKTYRISMLALICRLFFNATKLTTERGPLYLSKSHKPFISSDMYNTKSLIDFIKHKDDYLNKFKTSNFPFKKDVLNNKYVAHNGGLVSFMKKVI